jgi:FkbM family methyltransferase
MLNSPRSIARHLRALHDIAKLNPDKERMSALRRAYVDAMVKRPAARQTTQKLLGFDVSYLSRTSFEYLFRELFLSHEYRFDTQNPTPLVVDCGSNIGMSVLYFKWLYPAARIVAFEPDVQAFQCLTANVAANGLRDVRVHNAAVSTADGSVDFYVDSLDPGSLQMSTLEARMPKDKARVSAIRLANVIDEPIDFLKMDIEGAEAAVISDLCDSGRMELVSQMAIEYHHHVRAGEDELAATLARLESAGFGYQLSGAMSRPFKRGAFQDVLIYAYNKRRHP